MIVSDIPNISVNQSQIDGNRISAEMQYHPADSRRGAMVKATQALIISEVVRQRAIEVGVWPADKPLESHQEESLIEQLIETDTHLPCATRTECEHFYQTNEEKFRTAPLLEVRHILLVADPDDIQQRGEAREVADSLLKQLSENPAEFAELASRHSGCPSAQMGGNLGQITKGQTVPEFERQIFAASEGLMRTPVESRYGFHLIDIVRRVEGKPLPFEHVKQDIQEYLDTKVKRKTIAQYITTLLSEADIQGFDFGLDGSPLMQ
ncbi:peptidylprolyl isomerase [Lacimicrobium sp. SS2-24]|uniref:peptidylprolyl isomerase n=1 Tax=Lacimicrobium sp. SS2-24 TaxID=2005569 RepID=UPI000B4B5CFA|nr:peptidylprolyl isomerase [Lacimicrobium sp. SS2-24]